MKCSGNGGVQTPPMQRRLIAGRTRNQDSQGQRIGRNDTNLPCTNVRLILVYTSSRNRRTTPWFTAPYTAEARSTQRVFFGGSGDQGLRYQ
jgi:hypothetical protein